MLVADISVGNDDDPGLTACTKAANASTLSIDETELRCSCPPTMADNGIDLGVVVGRELRTGDVISADETQVLVALEINHEVSNRHSNLAVDGSRTYLPHADSRKQREVEVRPHLSDGAIGDYDEVTPTLFDERDGGRIPSVDLDRGSDCDYSHSHGHMYYTNSNENGGHFHGIQATNPEGSL